MPPALGRGGRVGITMSPARPTSCVSRASSVCLSRASRTNEKTNEPAPSPNFIRKLIADDHASGRFDGRVVARFPPEPNGYLHIGRAKSICLNFGLAAQHPGGVCHVRFDDANPTREEVEYVESIKADVR